MYDPEGGAQQGDFNRVWFRCLRVSKLENLLVEGFLKSRAKKNPTLLRFFFFFREGFFPRDRKKRKKNLV